MFNTESSMDPLHANYPGDYYEVDMEDDSTELEPVTQQGTTTTSPTSPMADIPEEEADGKPVAVKETTTTTGHETQAATTPTPQAATEEKEPRNKISQQYKHQYKHHNRVESESNIPFGGILQHGISDLPESCRGASDRGRFQEQEHAVRQRARHSVVWLAMINGYSALKVFLYHLISLESLLSIALSVGLTVFTYYKTEDNPGFDGSALDWVLLSFAVITPMSTSIGMAFSRREKALENLTTIRSTMLELYCAHASWDWCKAGKKETTGRAISTTTDWLEHADAAFVEILGICHTLSRFLTLPNATRARHRITTQGRKEAAYTLSLSSKLYGCMLVRFGRLTDLCEILKAEGLPPNEATRIRQWERMVLEASDHLRMIKLYRTPQALRSFARLFTVFLPPFYAPSYAEIARSVNSLAVAIIFSVLTSLALTALFETISQMEDPFLGYTSLDGVDVDGELSSAFVVQCTILRSHFFRDAKPFDEQRVTTTTCEKLPVREFTMVSTAKTKWRKRPTKLGN